MQCSANVLARLNKISAKIKDFHSSYKALVVALKKKTLRLYTIFPGFNPIFQTFSRSGKLLGNFQEFFKNSRLCMDPGEHASTTIDFVSCKASKPFYTVKALVPWVIHQLVICGLFRLFSLTFEVCQ